MSRTVLNHQGSPDTACRHRRRERFRKRFLQLPYGMFDVYDLALNVGIPLQTALAYLRELHREGLVKHEVIKRNLHGLKLDMPVWSRIK